VIDTRWIDVVRSPLGNAARLAVHVTGRGPLMVLVHGYPLDHRLWLDLLHSPLAAHRTLCAVDLRGHGSSPWAGDPVHAMELLADDVAAVIRTLSDDGHADVCGLSMGGYVALALWARRRQHVRSLVLCNTKAAPDTEAGRAARDAAIATVVEQGRRAIVDTMLGKLLAPGADPLVKARVQSMMEDVPVESYVADLRGMKERADRRPMLADITVPTVVVAGELDAIAPPAEGRAMADAIKGARFVAVKGAAHLVPIEQPNEFAGAADRLP
jgi:pimeloyl-ACP methyl ester carboxylesterase